MAATFSDINVEVLDLSSFDTSNVTFMYQMFFNSKNLETIYVSDKFVTDNVTNSDRMFYDNTNLIGENGTKYSSSNPKDKTYARIDGGTDSPGYFTLKSN